MYIYEIVLVAITTDTCEIVIVVQAKKNLYTIITIITCNRKLYSFIAKIENPVP
jgi:hypothetical protein